MFTTFCFKVLSLTNTTNNDPKHVFTPNSTNRYLNQCKSEF